MRVHILVLLSCLLVAVACAKAPEVTQDPMATIDEIELTEAMEFSTSAEDVVAAAPGWYRVERAGESEMRLVPAAGGEPLIIAAEARPHEEQLEKDVAIASLENDAFHVVLLRSGGEGLEANGYRATEITERGAAQRYRPSMRRSYRRLPSRRLSAYANAKRIPSSPKSFSADLVQLTPQGGIRRQGSALVHPRYVRFESSGVQQGRGAIVIVRRDAKVVWILDPSRKEYVEYPFDEAAIKNQIRQRGGSETARTVRQTTVSGYATVEQALDQQLTIQGSRKRRTITAWTSSQLGTSLAIREADGSRAEFRSIRQRGISSSEFAIPPGYRKTAVIREEPQEPPHRLDHCDDMSDPMEPCKVSFKPSSGGVPLTKEQCKQRCKGGLAGDMFWATLTGVGWNPIGWIISGIRYDDCMRACNRIGRETMGGGGGGGSVDSPPLRMK